MSTSVYALDLHPVKHACHPVDVADLYIFYTFTASPLCPDLPRP